jgi:uncharacterized membrane protein
MAKIPQVNNCCFVVPLRTGAFIVAAWMFIWNLYSGAMLLVFPMIGTFGIILKVIAIPMLLVAIAAFLGARAIYQNDADKTHLFSKVYLGSVVVYFLVQIVYIVILYVAAGSALSSAQTHLDSAAKQCRDSQAQLDPKYRTPGICDQVASSASAATGAASVGLVAWLIPFIIGIVLNFYFYVVIRSYALELKEKKNKPEF